MRDVIGLGSKGSTSLLVSVKSRRGALIEGYVENGNWSFTMNLLTGRMEYSPPSGSAVTYDFYVTYVGLIPRVIGDYNRVLSWMIDNPSPPRFWWRLQFLLPAMIYKFRQVQATISKLRNALRTLNRPLPEKVEQPCGDDDIPF